MTDKQKLALGAILRAILLIIFNPLVKRHFISLDLLNPAVADLANQLIEWAISGAVVLWSLANKWLLSRKVDVALALPAGSTKEDVNAVVKQTNPGLTKVPL
jgi:hypothetical protein